MIILSKYGSAVFLAQEAARKAIPRPKIIETLPYIWQNNKMINNPRYINQGTKEEQRIKRWERENKDREFIINYLKENYPNSDYAEKYDSEDNCNIPLRFHNEQTLNCEYLAEDKRHCIKERDTSCYTCCYVCYHGSICDNNNCIYLNEVK